MIPPKKLLRKTTVFPPRSCYVRLFPPGRHRGASSREEAPLPGKKVAELAGVILAKDEELASALAAEDEELVALSSRTVFVCLILYQLIMTR